MKTLKLTISLSAIILLLIVTGTREVVNLGELFPYMPNETVNGKYLHYLPEYERVTVAEGFNWYEGSTTHYKFTVLTKDDVIRTLIAHCNGCGLVLGDLVGVWGRPVKMFRFGGTCYAAWNGYRALIVCHSKNGMGLYDLNNKVVYLRFTDNEANIQ